MKTVLITGGSRGIGSSLVKAFSSKGYNTVFCYLNNEDTALELSRKCDAEAIKCDVTNEEQVLSLIRKIGNVDVLINNAGISGYGLLTDISLKEWKQIFAVNVEGVFLFSKAVLPGMIHKRKGCIINISSMWGEIGASCEVAYSSSKAAVIGFTKALAKEVGLSGVRVNCIAPGVIATDMMKIFNQQEVKELCEAAPLNRIGQPEDVAAAALFLASESANFITGQVIGVNGGFVI